MRAPVVAILFIASSLFVRARIITSFNSFTLSFKGISKYISLAEVTSISLKMPGSYPINAASTVCRPTGTCGILKRPRLSVIVPAPSFSDSFTVAYGIGNFESPSITIPRMVCTGRPFRPVVWLNTVTDTNKAINNRIHPP